MYCSIAYCRHCLSSVSLRTSECFRVCHWVPWRQMAINHLPIKLTISFSRCKDVMQCQAHLSSWQVGSGLPLLLVLFCCVLRWMCLMPLIEIDIRTSGFILLGTYCLITIPLFLFFPLISTVCLAGHIGNCETVSWITISHIHPLWAVT